MIGLKLRNKFNKSHTSVNLQSCKKQWNKFSKVLRKAKQKYRNNLNFKSITGTNKFWKTVKPLFSNKNKTANTIILNKNNRIVKDNKNISHTLNKSFTYMTKTLKSKKTLTALKKKSLDNLLWYFKNHSTKKTEKHFDGKEVFTFFKFKEIEIEKSVKELPKTKLALSKTF